MNPMTESLLFIRALLAHRDHLEAQMGEDWPEFKAALERCLAGLEKVEGDDQMQLLVDELFYAGTATPAEPLVRALFKQAVQQAGNVDDQTGSVRMRDPTSGEAREVPAQPALPGETINRWDVARAMTRLGQTIGLLYTVVGLSVYHIGDGNVNLSGLQETATDDDGTGGVTRPVKTYANLQGDDYAYLNQPYRLTVKLSDQPQQAGRHVAAPEMTVPARPDEVIKKIRVTLTAPDFELAPAEQSTGWQRELTFYVEAAASNTVTFSLIPQDRFEPRYFATLKVQYSHQGEVMGDAFRRVEVLREAQIEKTPLNAFPKAPGYPLDEQGRVRLEPRPTPVYFQQSDSPHHLNVTLTVTISEREAQGDLLWQFVSPYLSEADDPSGPHTSRNLGAEEFVKTYLAPFGMPGNWPEDHMDTTGHLKNGSLPILFQNLIELRHSVPEAFWRLYGLALDHHQQAGHSAESFTILFRTADTHIPWELMPLSEQAVDGKMPPLLGSAHRVGRWLLDVGRPLPRADLTLQGFTLAAPTYADDPLPEAQQERTYLEQRYRPYTLPDDPDSFLTFMKNGQTTGGAGLLHFAGHGDCCIDPQRGNWLILTNKQTFYDARSASNNLGNGLGQLRPTFAFFNACNVGRAAPGPLGSNGGWGRALLRQQYEGYIGPLWSVFDEHARDISQTFYHLALDEGLPLGEVMRRIRATFSEDNRLFTYLAYLYLGHPLAKITYQPFEEITDV